MSFSNLFLPENQNQNSPTKINLPDRFTILCVDDDLSILKALIRVFRKQNYQILTAKSGDEALKIFKDSKNSIQMIISDYQMPGMNGAELLRQVKSLTPETIRIMLTGHADSNAVMGAINEGAVYKFILKPWNDDDLRITVSLAFEQYSLQKRNIRLKETTQRQQKQLKKLSEISILNKSKLPVFLLKNKLLSENNYNKLLKLMRTYKSAPSIGIIFENKWLTSHQIFSAIKKKQIIEEINIEEVMVDSVVCDLIPHGFCRKQVISPLKINNGKLLVAVADPFDEGLQSDLNFITGMAVEFVLSSADEIQQKLKSIYELDEQFLTSQIDNIDSTLDPFESIEIVIEDEDKDNIEDLLRSSEAPPAVRIVNAVVLEAVRMGASDIHIQPKAKFVVVRYRIDGILLNKIDLPLSLHPSVVSRIKIMANLDISERRKPQDGRITIKTPMRIVDLRISTLPTINGEKVVLRILDRNASIFKLNDLGFTEKQKAIVERIMQQPQGMVLATGPTGSGKTTTLYSLIHHGLDSTKNCITIEDPVEYYLDHAGQVNVHKKINLTFPGVLRAVLRQDPDIILLGEIRDLETAEVAFNAALTGHFVYSTLHTNNALATISRLYDMGLKPYLLANSLSGIIAQRLVRKICEFCKVPVKPKNQTDLLAKIGGIFRTLEYVTYNGGGCINCNNTGYSGRSPIYEIIEFNDLVREQILLQGFDVELRNLKPFLNGQLLTDSAELQVKSGKTSLEEVLRVLGPQIDFIS